MMMGSVPSTFQERPEALYGVGMCISICITDTVVDYCMGDCVADGPVRTEFIRNQQGPGWIDGVLDKLKNSLSGKIAGNLSNYPSAAFYRTDYRGFTGSPASWILEIRGGGGGGGGVFFFFC